MKNIVKLLFIFILTSLIFPSVVLALERCYYGDPQNPSWWDCPEIQPENCVGTCPPGWCCSTTYPNYCTGTRKCYADPSPCSSCGGALNIPSSCCFDDNQAIKHVEEWVSQGYPCGGFTGGTSTATFGCNVNNHPNDCLAYCAGGCQDGLCLPCGVNPAGCQNALTCPNGNGCDCSAECSGSTCWGSSAGSYTCHSTLAPPGYYAPDVASCCDGCLLNPETKQCYTALYWTYVQDCSTGCCPSDPSNSCCFAVSNLQDEPDPVNAGEQITFSADVQGAADPTQLFICKDGDCTDCNQGAVSTTISTTIDTVGGTGYYTSIAIGNDGKPVISHFDDTNDDLRVCHCNDAACTSAACNTIDSVGDVGSYTSIAIGNDGKPVISHFDDTNDDLRVCHCNDAACTSAVCNTIDSEGTAGSYTSIAIGNDGKPVISHRTSYTGLRVCHCNDAACTSAACNTIDSTGYVGSYTSIAIGNDGYPVISHFDAANADLRVCHCNDAACTSAACNTIDSTGHVGSFTSIAIGSDDKPVISHYDRTNGNLRVCHCNDATCTSAACTTIDSGGDVGAYTSIAIGSDGYPVISHSDSAPNYDLRVCHCNDADCSSPATCTTIEPGGYYGTSIAIGDDNLPVISHNDGGDGGDLRVCHCNDAACTSAACNTIDSTDFVGIYSSIAIGKDGYPIISHFDETNDDLRVCHCNDEICTSAACTTIDSEGYVGAYTSIAIGNDGYPIISSSGGGLRVCHCNDAACTSPATCTTIDSGVYVGSYSSIAIGNDDYPVISYKLSGDLQVHHCIDETCSITVKNNKFNCWCNTPFSTAASKSCSYTTTDSDVGTNDYWAKACESDGRCTAVIPGDGFTVTGRGSISGNVKNTDNENIEGARIDAIQGTTLKYTADTDTLGDYQILDVIVGTYNMIASASGYVSSTKTNVNTLSDVEVIVDFTLTPGITCEYDCTYEGDNVIHKECHGINGCNFCDTTPEILENAKNICALAQPGWVREYDENNVIECAEGCPQSKLKATVTCEKENLIKITKLVTYKGKLVKLVIVTCG